MIRRTAFEDFEALQDVVQDNESEVMQIGAGRMHGAITHFAVDPTFGISTGQFSQAISATGVLSDARWALGFLTASDGIALGHNGEMAVGDLVTAAPGVERYTRFQNNTAYVAVMIAPERLQSHLATQPGAYDRLLRHELAVLRATPAAASHNVRDLGVLLDAMAPEDGSMVTDEAVAFYQRNIIELLTASMRDGVPYQGSHLAKAERIVHGIEVYVTTMGARPVHVSELCEHLGIHRRTLHRAFREVLGIGPIQYLRKRRLNDAHRALRAARPHSKIATIARNHGFAELGRFAREYRHQFGELPSHTLRRNTTSG